MFKFWFLSFFCTFLVLSTWNWQVLHLCVGSLFPHSEWRIGTRDCAFPQKFDNMLEKAQNAAAENSSRLIHCCCELNKNQRSWSFFHIFICTFIYFDLFILARRCVPKTSRWSFYQREVWYFSPKVWTWRRISVHKAEQETTRKAKDAV